jgi:hypothetical protein
MSAAPAPTPAPVAPAVPTPAAAASGVLGFLGLGGKPVNKGANNKGSANNKGANNKGSANNKGTANNAGANNKGANTAALNASLAPTAPAATTTATAAARRRTRKQRGGARGKTMRLPGARNVLRVTGKTARKLGRVGVYGLKKVGNGVHVVTGLLGGVLKKTRNVFRGLTKRRKQ